MSKGLCALLGVSAILAIAPCGVAGDTRTIVGRLADVYPEISPVRSDDDAEVLVIRTGKAGDVAVTVGRRTRYLKWVTRQPWQQDRRAKASALRIGKLVSIDVAKDGERLVARVVRIATD
ncbi:MAG: hypothetical protein DMF78_04760 [Acidobacteria bacterium]|nr:MAG: hypothetical protein DMF78_04760 [Acidobacteriota bacterium]